VKHRDALKDHIQNRGVATEVYYPVPMHLQECFEYLKLEKGDFPESEAASLETLALPVYPELSEEQAEYVVKQVVGFFEEKANRRNVAGTVFA
jgi:dTDP-4-amino-4,6-dideoxygalactose transaminase